VQTLFDRAYERLGARYPAALLAVALRLEHLAVLFGVVVFALYVPHMSAGEFALLSVAAVAGQEFYAQLTDRRFRDRLRPLSDWIAAGGPEATAARAWSVAASMPYELLRTWWRGKYPGVAGLAWSIFAVWVLEQPAWTVPVLFLTIQVLLAYANGLAALFVERGVQPMLDELGTKISEELIPDAIGLPLSRRLMLGLPAMNVGLGVLVIGIFDTGHPGIGAMAIAAMISLAVALTAGFLFTFLLSTSVVSPIRRLQEATERVAAGDLATRVPVSASDETGALTQAFNRMVGGLAERERLREAFGTFVDPELAARVSRDGTDLRGEELDVSIMFMDCAVSPRSRRARAPPKSSRG
jgi:HAMP domain-containing protein